MFNEQKILIGFLGGALGAILADLHAYSQAPEGQAFNWRKAAARWGAGGVSGVMMALGLSATGIGA